MRFLTTIVIITRCHDNKYCFLPLRKPLLCPLMLFPPSSLRYTSLFRDIHHRFLLLFSSAPWYCIFLLRDPLILCTLKLLFFLRDDVPLRFAIILSALLVTVLLLSMLLYISASRYSSPLHLKPVFHSSWCFCSLLRDIVFPRFKILISYASW